jgi:endoglucanase
VIDLTFEGKSTSEGQAYALFFALVANERARFDAILRWTSDNLAAGQLGARLPAWLWGAKPDGSWGVKDANSASDADLWLAYTLLEAARLWAAPAYADTARQLLAQISKLETAPFGAAGKVLLPGPVGFVLEGGTLRFNPSYVPGFLMRALASADPQGPWAAIWATTLAFGPELFPAGVAPDNVQIDLLGSVRPDPPSDGASPAVGSYDAIRVYLWAGLSAPADPRWLQRLAPFAGLIRKLGVPPEKVNVQTGLALPSDFSPIGFAGAVLPFLSALGDSVALKQQSDRLAAAASRAEWGETTHYFDQVLILFGQGAWEQRYRFDASGHLQPHWHVPAGA